MPAANADNVLTAFIAGDDPLEQHMIITSVSSSVFLGMELMFWGRLTPQALHRRQLFVCSHTHEQGWVRKKAEK